MLGFHRARGAIALIVAILGVSVPGCASGEDREPTHPVSGKVVFPDGKPAEHAIVVFHPVGATPTTHKPRGVVRKDGSYSLTTYDGNDGAPAGEYQVTVELWMTTGNGDEGPRSRLPSRYSSPSTSGIRAAVADARTEIKTIELKR